MTAWAFAAQWLGLVDAYVDLARLRELTVSLTPTEAQKAFEECNAAPHLRKKPVLVVDGKVRGSKGRNPGAFEKSEYNVQGTTMFGCPACGVVGFQTAAAVTLHLKRCCRCVNHTLEMMLQKLVNAHKMDDVDYKYTRNVTAEAPRGEGLHARIERQREDLAALEARTADAEMDALQLEGLLDERQQTLLNAAIVAVLAEARAGQRRLLEESEGLDAAGQVSLPQGHVSGGTLDALIRLALHGSSFEGVAVCLLSRSLRRRSTEGVGAGEDVEKEALRRVVEGAERAAESASRSGEPPGAELRDALVLGQLVLQRRERLHDLVREKFDQMSGRLPKLLPELRLARAEAEGGGLGGWLREARQMGGALASCRGGFLIAAVRRLKRAWGLADVSEEGWEDRGEEHDAASPPDAAGGGAEGAAEGMLLDLDALVLPPGETVEQEMRVLVRAVECYASELRLARAEAEGGGLGGWLREARQMGGALASCRGGFLIAAVRRLKRAWGLADVSEEGWEDRGEEHDAASPPDAAGGGAEGAAEGMLLDLDALVLPPGETVEQEMRVLVRAVEGYARRQVLLDEAVARAAASQRHPPDAEQMAACFSSADLSKWHPLALYYMDRYRLMEATRHMEPEYRRLGSSPAHAWRQRLAEILSFLWSSSGAWYCGDARVYAGSSAEPYGCIVPPPRPLTTLLLRGGYIGDDDETPIGCTQLAQELLSILIKAGVISNRQSLLNPPVLAPAQWVAYDAVRTWVLHMRWMAPPDALPRGVAFVARVVYPGNQADAQQALMYARRSSNPGLAGAPYAVLTSRLIAPLCVQVDFGVGGRKAQWPAHGPRRVAAARSGEPPAGNESTD